MLLRCCLIHISIIILRHFLYLLYLRPLLDVGLFISYLCDLFFIFMFTFTDILLLLLIFQNMYYYFWIITGMKKNVNNFQTTKVQPQGVAQHLLDFCQFQPGVTYKSVAYKKKRVYTFITNSQLQKDARKESVYFIGKKVHIRNLYIDSNDELVLCNESSKQKTKEIENAFSTQNFP